MGKFSGRRWLAAEAASVPKADAGQRCFVSHCLAEDREIGGLCWCRLKGPLVDSVLWILRGFVSESHFGLHLRPVIVTGRRSDHPPCASGKPGGAASLRPLWDFLGWCGEHRSTSAQCTASCPCIAMLSGAPRCRPVLRCLRVMQSASKLYFAGEKDAALILGVDQSDAA